MNDFAPSMMLASLPLESQEMPNKRFTTTKYSDITFILVRKQNINGCDVYLLYTILELLDLELHTCSSLSINPIIVSMVINVPVLPIPALQCTTIGPFVWIRRMYLAYLNSGNEDGGTP